MSRRAVAAGRELDSRYRLIEKLGAGGQGEVWRAHDERRGQDIAVKVLNPKLARDARAWASLEHEHAIASRLDHPSILKILAPERIGEVAMLPMELAPGGDLRRLRCTGYLEIIPVLIEVAQALEHAHERGVIHRDLKPSNVLFDAHGNVKLADFGVAGIYVPDGAGPEQGGRGHSPFSASPEQLRGEPPQPADDIYGLGALAYELLSGYPPHYPRFDAQRIREDPVPVLVSARPMPPLLGALVTRMLDKDPQARPRTMREVIDELDTALHDTLDFKLDSAETITEQDLEASLEGSETIPELSVETALAEHDRAVDPLEATATLPVLPAVSRPRAASAQQTALETTVTTVADEPAPAAPVPEASVPAVSPPATVHEEESLRAPIAVAGPGPWRDLGLTAAPSAAGLTRMRAQWPYIAAAAAFMAAAGVGVLWMIRSHGLPGATEPAPRLEATQAAASASASSAAASEQRYQGAHQRFARELAALEARAAGVWGGESFATAKTLAAESIGAHDAGNLAIALDRLDHAGRLLDQVQKEAPAAVATQLAIGERALASGQQEVATQAFDLARRIDPANRRVAEDEHRARNLNALLPLLAAARNAENARSYSRAIQDYNRALALDPSSIRARQGLARVSTAYQDERYARAVGAGFTALGLGHLYEARAAFERAHALRPQGVEVAEGMKRVAAAAAARNFSALRQKAADLEAQERWEAAERVYESALRQDPSMVFALEGKERTASRAALARSLQALIDHPDRLTSPATRDQAIAVIRSASTQPDPGPVLLGQLARLRALMPDVDKPVHLSLVSDNATRVTIPSIGIFGTFARRDIELKPGRYTVIGTRDGYREVRRSITVAPGQRSITIQVTCSDRT